MARSIFGSVIEGLIPQSKFKNKAQLAKDIGIPKPTFSNWIHGKHGPKKYGAILEIADRLNWGGEKDKYKLVFLLVESLAMDEENREERSKK